MKRIFYFCNIFLLLSIMFSCSPSLTITMNKDESADFNFDIKNTESFFSNFSAFMDFSQDNFYDKDILKTNLQEIGFSNINIEIGQNADLQVLAKITNLNQNNQNPFTSLFYKTENAFIIEINPEKIIQTLTSISEITDYLDLLMAPVYTGENLSEQEYLELFASVYGDSFAKDFENTTLILYIDSLQKIKNVKNPDSKIGELTFSDKTATLKIPLYKLLCSKNLNIFKIEF